MLPHGLTPAATRPRVAPGVRYGTVFLRCQCGVVGLRSIEPGLAQRGVYFFPPTYEHIRTIVHSSNEAGMRSYF